MQQQGSKAETPPKKGAHFFSETPFLTIFFKNTNFAPPPENCAQKISQNPYFYRFKKGGQVIDPKVAKLLTLLWPKNGQVIDPTAYVYIYIYMYIFFVPLYLYIYIYWPRPLFPTPNLQKWPKPQRGTFYVFNRFCPKMDVLRTGLKDQ